ncbi:MAG: hypothetical protein BGN96_04730 [Bacteroidales bacterium 45-6]|nr:MAG: hypothetical protein BGN96_04730 [Bacteroidales bacterium 45-6]
MLQIGETVVGLDIIEEKFCCNLAVCKGWCCVDGESGAPLEKEEVADLERVLPEVWDDLSPQAQEVIEKQGVAYKDMDGDMVTSIVNGKDCVFTYHDPQGICRCAIEKAYREGRIDFYKPISCHLYPIRLQKYRDFTAVNYHRWSICKPAVALGKDKGLRIYQFLKEPLVRKFGEEWYNELEVTAEEYLKSK